MNLLIISGLGAKIHKFKREGLFKRIQKTRDANFAHSFKLGAKISREKYVKFGEGKYDVF